jgi:non-homologous end joining protein Ku
MASPAGNPVKQVYVDEVTGEIVGPRTECAKGIFDNDGFHEVSNEAMKQIDEAIALESITIEGFIPLDEVPWERATSHAYYLAPDGKGPAAAKPLALLRDGLRHFDRAGYGRVTVRDITYAFVITSREVSEGKYGLFLTPLSYASQVEVERAAEVLDGIETDDKTLALVGTLFDQTGGTRVALDSYADDRTEKRTELIALAVAGKAIPQAEKAEKVEEPTADLADLLTASITAATSTSKKGGKKPKVAA